MRHCMYRNYPNRRYFKYENKHTIGTRFFTIIMATKPKLYFIHLCVRMVESSRNIYKRAIQRTYHNILLKLKQTDIARVIQYYYITIFTSWRLWILFSLCCCGAARSQFHFALFCQNSDVAGSVGKRFRALYTQFIIQLRRSECLVRIIQIRGAYILIYKYNKRTQPTATLMWGLHNDAFVHLVYWNTCCTIH